MSAAHSGASALRPHLEPADWVDTNGIIYAPFDNTDHRRRTEPEAIVAALSKL